MPPSSLTTEGSLSGYREEKAGVGGESVSSTRRTAHGREACLSLQQVSCTVMCGRGEMRRRGVRISGAFGDD